MYLKGTPNFHALRSSERELRNHKSNVLTPFQEDQLIRDGLRFFDSRPASPKPRPPFHKKNPSLYSYMKITKCIPHKRTESYKEKAKASSIAPNLPREERPLTFFTSLMDHSELIEEDEEEDYDDDDHTRETTLSLGMETRQKPQICPYMQCQGYFTIAMRTMLLDWVIEVHNKLKFQHRTLYLAQHIVDRYFQTTEIEVRQLQLIAVASLYIALKVEENVEISAEQFASIADGAFEFDQLRRMEFTLLDELEFPVFEPVPYDFASLWASMLDFNPQQLQLLYFFLDCAVLSYEVTSGHDPSFIAAAIVQLAIYIPTAQDYRDFNRQFRKAKPVLPLRDTNEEQVTDVAKKLLQSVKEARKEGRRGLFKKHPKILDALL